jgi:hypothetical protein
MPDYIVMWKLCCKAKARWDSRKEGSKRNAAVEVQLLLGCDMQVFCGAKCGRVVVHKGVVGSVNV